MAPIPFLNAKRLGDKMELDSRHQSSLVLSVCSKILLSEEDSANGQNYEFGLGIGMTL